MVQWESKILSGDIDKSRHTPLSGWAIPPISVVYKCTGLTPISPIGSIMDSQRVSENFGIRA